MSHDVRTELFYNGVWNDITPDVRYDPPITYRRGRADEAAVPAPSQLTLTLNNGQSNVNPAVSGRYSPRNPRSDLYGLIGRNTPIQVVGVGGGEVTAWPPEWDLSGKDVQVPITASGIRRRLGQGVPPLRSTLYRYLAGRSNVVAYWPMEDGENATSFASALTNRSSALAPSGKVTPAQYDKYPSSTPLPIFEAVGNVDGYVEGTVGRYTGVSKQRMSFLIAAPATGLAFSGVIFQFITGGPYTRWELVLQTDGHLYMRALNDEGNAVLTTPTLNYALNGKLALLSISITQTGPDIDWQVAVRQSGIAVTATNGWLMGRTFDRIRSVVLLGNKEIAYGHLHVTNDTADATWNSSQLPFEAWAGEPVGARLRRLGAEEGVTINTPDTVGPKLGPQRVDTFLHLLDASAHVEGGILYDTATTLEYRKPGIDNRVWLTLDYALGQVAPPLAPVEDDQALRNDVTVTRDGGSSARAVLETGALSVQVPPNGVGRYDTEETLSLYTDQQLADQAGWRLHLGTVDEARYPLITVDLTATPEKGAAGGTFNDATAVQLGDRIQIVNPPPWLPPEPIDQIVQGVTVTVSPHRHIITFNTTPYSPYITGVVSGGTDQQRLGTDGSTTAAAFTAGTDTALSVSTSSGPLWTTVAGELPLTIMVAGVELSVTAIAGAASPQTFTVTKAPVNGISKTIPSGATVRLKQPMIIAL